MTTKTQERQHVNAWVEPRVVEQLDARAAAADRSRSAEVRRALARYVQDVADERDHDDEREGT